MGEKKRKGVMTFRRFRELWDKAGFRFECSEHLSKALIKMARGDSSDFDEIERRLANDGSEPRARTEKNT